MPSLNRRPNRSEMRSRILDNEVTVMLGNDLTQRPIDTEEQATKLVETYCERAVDARKLCDVVIPDDTEATVQHQNKAYQHWLMNYGAAIGALVALKNARKISDNAYKQLQQRVFSTLAPRVVGDIVSPIRLVT